MGKHEVLRRRAGLLMMAGLGLGACLLLAGYDRAGVAAQPAPTLTPGPSATPLLPPPSIAGDWSISRTWYRSCPGCGFPVSRTTTWRITQFGVHVTVDKGLRGVIVGAADGTGLLSLEGVESAGPDVYRFLYATLRVSADGSRMEGGFNGSESTSNPCGEDPPMVSCFAQNGYLTGRRIGLLTPVPSPPGPPVPTGLPTPFPLPSDTATPPSTATPTATDTPLPPTLTLTPSATATATPRPLRPALLPLALRQEAATEVPTPEPSTEPSAVPSPPPSPAP